MDDELNFNSDNLHGYTVFNSSIDRDFSSSGEAESSAADELGFPFSEEDLGSGDYSLESDTDYSDIINAIDDNTSSITSVEEKLELYFASQELLLKGIIILFLGFIVIQVVRKTFDILS